MAVTIRNSEVNLRRFLSLSVLIIYGIILIKPGAALPLFGHANHLLPDILNHFWIFFFTGGFAMLNLTGIRFASRTNWVFI